MIDLDPNVRPTTEQIKADPWFRGIDWDVIEHGPATSRTFISVVLHSFRDVDIPLIGSFKPELTKPHMRRSPRYSSFDRVQRAPAMVQYCTTKRQEDSVYNNVVKQMLRYKERPLAFVYPPTPTAHIV